MATNTVPQEDSGVPNKHPEHSSTRFSRLIAERIHECAPDHSVETISVGELRRAANEMDEVCNALSIVTRTLEIVNETLAERGGGKAPSAITAAQIGRHALAKARGGSDA